MIMRKSFVACLFFLGLSACVPQPAFSTVLDKIRIDNITDQDITAIGRGISFNAQDCFYDQIIDQLSFIEETDIINSWVVVTDQSVELHYSDGMKTACYIDHAGYYSPIDGWIYDPYE